MSKEKAVAGRKFFESSEFETKSDDESRSGDPESICSYIRKNVIGNRTSFHGPYGQREVLYCDFVASGRSLECIEDFIKQEVLPNYGNTHTTTSVTSLQTTLYRHEARNMIRNAVKASEHDAVVFVGSGCTGAVHKLIHAMGLKEAPVVLVGPMEHHSNLLPWREIACEVVSIKETPSGEINLSHLEEELKDLQGNPRLKGRAVIGCFSAASNITGTLADDKAVTAVLHLYGAYAFWDYAAAAPYVNINMNPVIPGSTQELVYKDAVFFSLHKFIGGVQTPGVLVAKKDLFHKASPTGCGGGSVFFVSRQDHRYLQDVEVKEEGGTPPIVESIRGGLVMHLHESITGDYIMRRNEELVRRAQSFWSSVDQLEVLGSPFVPRLPIFSFLIRSPCGLYLHFNYVCQLLNDLFGIQARGGCACAGPYAQELLGIDEQLAAQYEEKLVEDSRLDRVHLRRQGEHSDSEVLRPGFVRLNLPYFYSDEEIDFILEGVKLVAENGWKLLPQYQFNPETSEWRHRKQNVFKDRKWLHWVRFTSTKMEFQQPPLNLDTSPPKHLQDCLSLARKLLSDVSKATHREKLGDQTLLFDDQGSRLRWFLLPSEAQEFLRTNVPPPRKPPFLPKRYSDARTKKNLCPEEVPEMSARTKRKLDEAMDDAEEHSCPTGLCSTCVVVQHIPQHKKFTAPKQVEAVKNTEQKADSNSRTLRTRTVERACPCEKRSKSETPSASELVPSKETIETLAVTALPKWHSPAKNILKPAMEALEEWKMIGDGDRVMVCLSGGKDSLSLLHTLRHYQFYARAHGIHFSLAAVTVDPQTSSYDPRPLIPYLKSLEMPYFYEEQGILKQAECIPSLKSICSFCSRMKRGRIYSAARTQGYNVLALGQHLDDLSESFLMSVFHNGRLRTMKANYTVKEGDLRVIRPFVFVREKDLRKFAESRKLPVIPENCPACFEAPKERHRVKQLLAQQEVLFPRLFHSLRSSMFPLMALSNVTDKFRLTTQKTEEGHSDDES